MILDSGLECYYRVAECGFRRQSIPVSDGSREVGLLSVITATLWKVEVDGVCTMGTSLRRIGSCGGVGCW